MRVLVITQVFPNAVLPHSAPFNRHQLAALGRRTEVAVWAPIPWLPAVSVTGTRTAAGRLAAVPPRATVDGLDVEHPRVPHVPGVPVAAGALHFAALGRRLRDIPRRSRPDVILGAWAYPDGFAAVALGACLGVPSVMKLHGSDVNVNARAWGPRQQLRWSLGRARRVVAVSRALAQRACDLGAPRARTVVVRNGVDTSRFFPRSRAEARLALGLRSGRRIVLFVGRLEAPKGLGDLLAAFARAAGQDDALDLVLVGEGSLSGQARALERRLGSGRVTVAGTQPHDRIPAWMAAADVVTLPSWNEGTPNVVLEAHACGRPVVATRVGGIPDLVTAPALGELVEPHDPASLSEALVRVASAGASPDAIVRRAAPIDWDDSAAHLHTVLEEARAS